MSSVTTDAIIIAADGGANHLKKLNLTPTKIIGDLDSLENRTYWEGKTEIAHDKNQETTDLEKCLDRIQPGLILAFGFAGARFDHTLEILHALQKYPNHRIIFFAGNDIIFRIPNTWDVSLSTGTRISVYPLEKTTVSTSRGLKFPLDNLTLVQGEKIGTSNATLESSVSITYTGGGLAGITHHKYHDAIIESL